MKKIILITLTACLTLTLFSCKSKPQAEDEALEAPVVEVQEEPAEEELELKSHDSTSKESGINAEVTQKTVDNSEIIKKVDAARNAAVEAGAEKYAKELLDQIDAVFESLKTKESDITKEGTELSNRYSTLANYINAKVLKEDIDENDLASFAQSNYDAGVEQLAKVEEAYSAEEDLSSEIIESADKAYSEFNKVFIAAYKSKAIEQRKLALASKKDADGVKAGVSRKDEYKQAVEMFQLGDSLYSMQNPKKAYEQYSNCKSLFAVLAKEVSEKREAALKAIEAAKKRVEESANIAAQADARTPIDEPIEGIEEEETVLLEEDTYENPEDAVIEITTVFEDEDLAEEEIIQESESPEETTIEDSEETEGQEE